MLAGVSVACSMRITGKSEMDKAKRRFYFHRKYTKYYMLEMFYGARKQVFFTFGPYVLILFYGASASTISLLFAVSAVACFLTSPLVGRTIDRFGYSATYDKRHFLRKNVVGKAIEEAYDHQDQSVRYHDHLNGLEDL